MQCDWSLPMVYRWINNKMTSLWEFIPFFYKNKNVKFIWNNSYLNVQNKESSAFLDTVAVRECDGRPRPQLSHFVYTQKTHKFNFLNNLTF